MRIRLVDDPRDPTIKEFGRLQRRVYYDANTLIPASIIGRMLGSNGPRGNFLLVAENGPTLLGGTLFHLLPAPRTGFSSFMGVAPEARGQGIARQLHDARFDVLDEATGKPVHGLFIDVEAPERLAAERVEAERQFGFDPFVRRAIFHALGFRKVNIGYAQPIGGPNGGPLTTLDLLYCPRQPVDDIELDLVLDTLRAYWAPWLGAERTELEVQRLRDRVEQGTRNKEQRTDNDPSLRFPSRRRAQHGLTVALV